MDPYSTLGLSLDATEAEIQTAYRKLVRKYHPDLHPDNPVAARKFREVQTAYDAIMSGQASSQHGTRQQAHAGRQRAHAEQQRGHSRHSQQTGQGEPRYTRAEWHAREGEWFRRQTDKACQNAARKAKPHADALYEKVLRAAEKLRRERDEFNARINTYNQAYNEAYSEALSRPAFGNPDAWYNIEVGQWAIPAFWGLCGLGVLSVFLIWMGWCVQ